MKLYNKIKLLKHEQNCQMIAGYRLTGGAYVGEFPDKNIERENGGE